jgi:hypothetical protein
MLRIASCIDLLNDPFIRGRLEEGHQHPDPDECVEYFLFGPLIQFSPEHSSLWFDFDELFEVSETAGATPVDLLRDLIWLVEAATRGEFAGPFYAALAEWAIGPDERGVDLLRDVREHLGADWAELLMWRERHAQHAH